MEDLIKEVTELHDIPARLGQRRYIDHHWLVSDIECRIGVDRYIVWGDDKAVLGGFEFGVLSEVVNIDRADFETRLVGIVVVRKGNAPQISLHAKGVGVFLPCLVGRKRIIRARRPRSLRES